MSRTERFLCGLKFGYANQALMTLAGFLLTPFFLHRIGQHDYGLWLLSTQIMAYMMLLDFGIVALLPRETAYATGRAGAVENAIDVPATVGQTTRLVLWQTPLVALAASIMWFWMPTSWEALQKPFGLVLLVFAIMFPARVFQATLEGLQDLAFLGAVQPGIWLVSTAITVGLVFAGFGLYALVIGWMAAQFMSGVICWYRLRSRFPNVLPWPLPALSGVAARQHLARGFWVSIAQVAHVLVNTTDILIIGKLIGPAAVVPYVCTGKLIGVLANQPGIVMQVAFPALSQMKTAESRKRLFEVCTALSQATLIISGAIVCVVLAINQGFVGWWVGVDLYSGFELTLLMLLSMVLRHWNTTTVYALLCFGYEQRISLTNLLDGFVTGSAAILLVWILGPIGAPLASIVGVCLVSLPGNVAALAREVGESAGSLIVPLRPWFARFLVLAGGASAMAGLELPRLFLVLVGGSISVAVVYCAVMLPVALKPPLGSYVRLRIDPLLLKWFGRARAKDLV